MSYLPSKLPLSEPCRTATVEPWRRALMDAAELIRTRGHCKGLYQSADGRLCIYGALRTVYDVKRGRCTPPDIFDLAERVHAMPITWNDAPERTAADVIEALERAARQ